jgi:hypothetical protein
MPATVAPERYSAITMKPFASSEHSVETKELTSADRCDSCSSAALLRAVMGPSELLFCANHGRKNYGVLVAGGWKIDDQTHRAFARPSSPQTDD